MIVGSNRLNLNPNSKRNLIWMMGKEGCSDVEEGEISDEEQSLAEINKDEDLKKKQKQKKQQVWKMEDLMKYSSNYATGLYNFAWAQAVSNKPFDNGIIMREEEEEEEEEEFEFGSDDDDEKLNKNVDDVDNKSLSFSKDGCNNVLLSEDGEKEEGELEEGEIELDGEMMEVTEVTSSSGGGGGGGDLMLDMVESNEEDEKQVGEEGLSDINEEALSETETETMVEKSLHGECSKLRSTLDSLLQMVVANGASCVDAIIPEYFARIQALNSMFFSMNSKQQELEKDGLSRLLTHVKGQCCALFSPDQLKEVEDMMCSLEALPIFSSVKAMDNHEDVRGSGVSTTQLGILGEVPICSSVKVMNNHEVTRGSSAVSRLGILGENPVTVKAMNNHEVIPANCEVSRNQLGILGENPVSATFKATNNHEVLPANCEVSRNQLGILGETPGQVLNSSKKFFLEPISVRFDDQSSTNVGSEKMKFGPSSGSMGRGRFGPLLDLHMDHDMDSLPSPTRETPKPLPIQKMQAVEDGTVKSELGNARVADRNQAHSYETDALKAVSTYQKKFGQTSFHHSTRLPSPTPSDESNDGGDDSKGEVSSSAVSNVGTFNPPISMPAVSSATSQKDSSSTYRFGPAQTVERLESGSNPVSKLMAKSRDPRLRVANSRVGTTDFNQRSLYGEQKSQNETLGGIASSRKHQVSAESMLDGQSLKRPRNGLTDPRVSGDAPILSRSGGWLQESSTVRPQPTPRTGNLGTDLGRFEYGVVSGFRQDTAGGNLNAKTVGNEQLPLPSLLKDIAVNPTMLIKLFMEQQRLAAEAQQRSSNLAQNSTTCSNLNVLQGAILANVSSSKSSGTEQTHAIKSETLAQTIPTGELLKVRMKPRDPRRILQNSSFQNNESISMYQANQDNSLVRQPVEQAQTTTMSPHSNPAPDIAQQFTKGLKNVAHLLSASQATKSAPIAPPTLPSQALPGKMDTADMLSVTTEVKDQQNGPGLKPEEEIEGHSQPQNKWEDVEHLFEGYDDEQKAAIHRERARRLEEQNKMFAARKLCLVLDLDHTLLNSAKFVEVDPVHDEILRIMEDQDREKPYRHLFRFSHMGMWTKLRPGVWNFLEKASKLFELHLYTMGNKLYATEMAKVLDPTGVLFSGRVISKGDDGDPFDGDERVPKTKDLEGVMGMESSVVIIDDSVRVWPHNKLNLIVVERYTYFPCSRRQFGLPGPSLLEIDRDERPEDGTLASSLAVIERIHENFFSNRSLHDVDVRNILASEQRKILGGCCILFSRVIPVGEVNPHLHPLWQSAEQFGAVCTNQIDEQVTHVVANSLGTDKVNWALSTGRFVVYPGWVEASALLYRRANEHDFAIKP